MENVLGKTSAPTKQLLPTQTKVKKKVLHHHTHTQANIVLPSKREKMQNKNCNEKLCYQNMNSNLTFMAQHKDLEFKMHYWNKHRLRRTSHGLERKKWREKEEREKKTEKMNVLLKYWPQQNIYRQHKHWSEKILRSTQTQANVA